jgi:hypothetical protein
MNHGHDSGALSRRQVDVVVVIDIDDSVEHDFFFSLSARTAARRHTSVDLRGTSFLQLSTRSLTPALSDGTESHALEREDITYSRFSTSTYRRSPKLMSVLTNTRTCGGSLPRRRDNETRTVGQFFE